MGVDWRFYKHPLLSTSVCQLHRAADVISIEASTRFQISLMGWCLIGDHIVDDYIKQLVATIRTASSLKSQIEDQRF